MKFNKFDLLLDELNIIEFNRKEGDKNFSDFCAIGEKLELQYFCGATRFCFINDDWDFVVKIEYSEYEGYNKTEKHNFKTATRYGVENLLAETKFFKRLKNGIEVYTQDKCYNYDKVTQYTHHDKKEIQDIHVNYQSLLFMINVPELWAICVIKCYGVNTLINLINWIDDNNVNDLHAGNVGMSKEMKPIIFDYAGF